jgi:hypothetical protein
LRNLRSSLCRSISIFKYQDIVPVLQQPFDGIVLAKGFERYLIKSYIHATWQKLYYKRPWNKQNIMQNFWRSRNIWAFPTWIKKAYLLLKNDALPWLSHKVKEARGYKWHYKIFSAKLIKKHSWLYKIPYSNQTTRMTGRYTGFSCFSSLILNEEGRPKALIVM